MKLHGFFRSSATYRVRIALNLKGIAYEHVAHHLRRGEQRSPEYLAINPQGLVPALELDDGTVLTQSLAICDYLDTVYPDPPLLPADPVRRARVSAFAQVIACDVHPVQNLKIQLRLKEHGWDQPAVDRWVGQVTEEGFDACEALIAGEPGPYCFAEGVTLADLMLVPHLVNARRVGVDLRWPRLLAAEEACLRLEEFRRAAPEAQPDRE